LRTTFSQIQAIITRQIRFNLTPVKVGDFSDEATALYVFRHCGRIRIKKAAVVRDVHAADGMLQSHRTECTQWLQPSPEAMLSADLSDSETADTSDSPIIAPDASSGINDCRRTTFVYHRRILRHV